MEQRNIVIDSIRITGRKEGFESDLEFYFYLYKFIGFPVIDLDEDNAAIKGDLWAFFQECSPRNFFKQGIAFRAEGKQVITLLLHQANDPDLFCIDLTGTGLRFFESYSTLDYYGLFQKVIDEGYHITRIDLALDVHHEINVVEEYFKNEWYCSKTKWHTATYSKCNGFEGTSLYLGKRSSENVLNIYDKRAERRISSQELPEGWTRYELRFHDYQKAQFLVERFLNGVPLEEVFLSELCIKVRFVEPDPTDSNKRRWKAADWWLELVNRNDPVPFIRPGISYDFIKWEDNFYKRCGSSILTYLKMGKRFEELTEELQARGIELSSSQELLVNNYNPDLEWVEA